MNDYQLLLSFLELASLITRDLVILLREHRQYADSINQIIGSRPQIQQITIDYPLHNMNQNPEGNPVNNDYQGIPVIVKPLNGLDQTTYLSQVSEQLYPANRIIGASLLLLMFGILWIYGWGSENTLVTTLTLPVSLGSQTIYGNLFIMSAVFAVIGFGLQLIYFKHSTAYALFTSIFIVSFTILMSPIFQKFWFNVFITNFHGLTPNDSNPDRFYVYSNSGQSIPINLYALKIALACAIAQLVMALGLFGRLTPLQVVISSLLFNLAWNFNHFLCMVLQQKSPDNRLFDDYQISNVYLFAATFGIVVSILIGKPLNHRTFVSCRFSIIHSQIGTFLIFSSFCTTTTFYSLKYTNVFGEFQRSLVWQEAFLGTFFALSASVIATYIFSILLGNGRIGTRESILGTIMGAVIYGPVAGTCTNIGAAIATGIAAGFLSALFFQRVYVIINEKGLHDSLGIILIFVISFLGTFVISPIVIRTYYNYSVNLTTLQNSVFDIIGASIVDYHAAGWALVYVGISIAIGLASGLIVGLLLKTFAKLTEEYEDKLIFNRDYGLRQPQSANRENRIHEQSLVKGDNRLNEPSLANRDNRLPEPQLVNRDYGIRESQLVEGHQIILVTLPTTEQLIN